MNSFPRRCRQALGLVVLFLFPAAWAGESIEQIRAAARDLHIDRRPASQAIVLKHINTIHELAGMGKLTPLEYGNVMAWHQMQNLRIAENAVAGIPGFTVTLQRVSDDATGWRIGSDTDLMVRRTDGRPVTLEDIQRIERAYRMQTVAHIREASGGKVEASMQSFDTGTDFMVAHDATTPTEFNRIASYFRSQGRDTYNRIEAARVEAQLRSSATIDPMDASHYVTEMVEQTRRKQNMMDQLQRQYAQTQNPTEKARIWARMEQLAYERNKYIQRINQVNQRVAGQGEGTFGAGNLVNVPQGLRYNPSGLQQQALDGFMHGLAQALTKPQSPLMQRKTAFTLALQLEGMSLNARTAYIQKLGGTQRQLVQQQLNQFREWRRMEESRPTPAEMSRLTDFLGQTEFGQKLMNLLNTEIELVSSPVSHNVMALADMYKHVSEVDQSVTNAAQMLGLVLDMARDVRDSRNNAELALAIGTRLAGMTTVGTVLQTLYAGTAGGDPMALVRAFAIYLCPKLSLPDLVRSLGMTSMDLAAGVLFDNQFMAIYASSHFSDDGTLERIEGVGQGRNAVHQLLHGIFYQREMDTVVGIFDNAKALASRRALGPEIMAGLDRISVDAFVKALESTIYGGDGGFMRGDARVQQARAEVQRYTELLGDLAQQQGRRRTDVPYTVGPEWMNESLALNRFDPASREAMRELMRLRQEAWARVVTALADAITDALEERHKADKELGDESYLVLYDWLAKVQKLFRELEILDLGMSWLEYESKLRFVGWDLQGSTEEQQIQAMIALQNYYQAYSTVLNMRNTVEAMYRTSAGGEQSLLIRPLTGSPPLTGDPSFDVPQAVATAEEVGEWLAHYEREFLAIKRQGTNDQLAMLDAPFDRRMLQEIAGAQINYSSANANIRSAEHARQQRWAINVFGRFMDSRASLNAISVAGQTRERKEQIVQEFRDHYLKGASSLRIVPPEHLANRTAHPGMAYVFSSVIRNIPPDASLRWRVGRDIIAEGPDALIEFTRTGSTRITLEADWTDSRRSLQPGRQLTEIHINVVASLPPPEDDDTPPEDAPPAVTAEGDPASPDRPAEDDSTLARDGDRPPQAPPGAATTPGEDPDRPVANLPPDLDDWTPDHGDDFDLGIDWGNMDWGRIVGDAAAKAVAQKIVFGQTAVLDFSGIITTTTPGPGGVPVPAPSVTGDPAGSSDAGPQAGPSSVSDRMSGSQFVEDSHLQYTIRGVRNPVLGEEVKGRDTTRTITGEVRPGDVISIQASGTAGSAIYGGYNSYSESTLSIRIAPQRGGAEERSSIKLGQGGSGSTSATLTVPEGARSVSGWVSCTTGWQNFNGFFDRSIIARFTFTVVTDPPEGDRQRVNMPDQEDDMTPAAPSPRLPTQSGVTVVRYIYQSSPGIEFDPVESTDGRTTATFTRMGLVRVWAQIELIRDGKTEHIETGMTDYNVQSPHFTLSFAPESASVGQPVTATITTTPPVPDRLLNVVWDAPPLRELTVRSPNATSVQFYAPAGEPMRFTAEARVPHFGDSIDIIQGEFASNPYTVKAEIAGRTGLRPRIWDPAAGGLVPAPEEAYQVHENIRLQASLEGEPQPRGLRWRWTLNEGATLRGASTSANIGVTRSEPGEVVAIVTATDARGTELGSDTVILFFSDDAAPPDDPVPPLVARLHASATTLPVGGSVQLQVLAEGGKPPYTVRWNGLRALGMQGTFSNTEIGTHRVSVTVTDAERNQTEAFVDIVVEPVQLQVQLRQPSERVHVGATIEITAEVDGGSPPYRYSWEPMRGARGQTVQASSPTPGPLNIRVTVTDANGSRGEAETTLDVLPLTLDLSIARRQGQAQIWDEGAARLVDIPDGTYAAGHSLDLVARLADGQLPRDARWTWSLEPSRNLARYRSGTDGPSASLQLLDKGRLTVRVTLQDARRNVLAEAELEIEISYSRDELQLEQNRAQVHRLLAEADTLEARSDLRGALQRLHAANRLLPSDEIARRIADLDARIEEEDRYQRLVQAARALERQADFQGALSKYEEAYGIKPSTEIQNRIDALRLLVAREKRWKELVDAATALERQGELERALERYREAETVKSDAAVQRKIRDLERQIGDRARAQALVHEGYTREQAGDLAAALENYTEANRLVPHDGIASRITQLQRQIADRDRAQALIREGYASEQAGNLTAALENYTEANRLVPHDGIAARIAQLQERIEAEERARAEQERLEADRRAEAARRAEAEAAQRRQAEERQRQEAARRAEAERERQEAARRAAQPPQSPPAPAATPRPAPVVSRAPFTGVFSGRFDMQAGGNRWTAFVDMDLQHQGNRVTGTMRTRTADAGGRMFDDETERISGTVQGNQLTIIQDGDRIVLTMSADRQTLTIIDDGKRYTLSRQNR
jgi:tetratricopeptide (TPR) repeat protein